MKLSYKYRTFDVPLCLLRCLKRRMRWIRAAGGIVSDEDGNLLLIQRNGRWDLPKGKVEAGETLMQAALREVGEETGIEVFAKAGNTLACKTYHVFNLYGGWHLKQTSWFRVNCVGTRPVGRPQGEEGITAVEWVAPDEWHSRLGSSYGTLRTLEQWVRKTRLS